MHRIMIIGSGFAGLTAARTLRKHDKTAEITLISPRREFVFYPGLIWVPSGQRKGPELVIDLSRFCRRRKINFIAAEATGLSKDGRVVKTTQGDIENDGLIIACGGKFIKKLPGIEHVITPCEGLEAVAAIRDRLADMDGGVIACGFSGNPDEPPAMRGGPIFEFLFGIDTLLRKQGRRDKFDMVFFTPAPSPGKRLGQKAVDRLLGQMQKRGIETRLGRKIKGFSDNAVTLEDGAFDADLVIFMPGMTGNDWFDDTALPRSPGGLIAADELCRVQDVRNVYVAGDAGSFPGPDWRPKQAHMADLQAEAAAKNLLDELAGRTPRARFKTELMCIVDSGDSGFLVARTPARNIVLPGSVVFHWAKRLFERLYLRKYR